MPANTNNDNKAVRRGLTPPAMDLSPRSRAAEEADDYGPVLDPMDTDGSSRGSSSGSEDEEPARTSFTTTTTTTTTTIIPFDPTTPTRESVARRRRRLAMPTPVGFRHTTNDRYLNPLPNRLVPTKSSRSSYSSPYANIPYTAQTENYRRSRAGRRPTALRRSAVAAVSTKPAAVPKTAKPSKPSKTPKTPKTPARTARPWARGGDPVRAYVRACQDASARASKVAGAGKVADKVADKAAGKMAGTSANKMVNKTTGTSANKTAGTSDTPKPKPKPSSK